MCISMHSGNVLLQDLDCVHQFLAIHILRGEISRIGMFLLATAYKRGFHILRGMIY